MEFVSFVMALSPILVVLVGILGFKQSAKKVSPVAFLWTIVLAFTFFNVDRISFADMVKVLDPLVWNCLLYTSPSPRDRQKSRMPSSA